MPGAHGSGMSTPSLLTARSAGIPALNRQENNLTLSSSYSQTSLRLQFRGSQSQGQTPVPKDCETPVCSARIEPRAAHLRHSYSSANELPLRKPAAAGQT